jgi:AraC-like DNA-binding protein
MNNTAHTAQRAGARQLVSGRPRVLKSEPDPVDGFLREECVQHGEWSQSRWEEIVNCSEPLERVLEVPRPSPCGKLQRLLLQRVLDRMKADLATDLDLDTLAAESGYSRSHFLRTFRAAMGCSPHQCLTRLRVEQAKTILREYATSLIDIALACGFFQPCPLFQHVSSDRGSNAQRLLAQSQWKYAKTAPFLKAALLNVHFSLSEGYSKVRVAT